MSNMSALSVVTQTSQRYIRAMVPMELIRALSVRNVDMKSDITTNNRRRKNV